MSQPSPETFIIECNRKLASEEYPNMNSQNHEWQNIINPSFQVKAGDEIKVSNTFINEIGASSDILIFNNNDEPDNKTRMIYSFYGMDDNINQKRNSINIAGRQHAGENHEYCTFNPIELMRYQPFAYWVRPSDVTVQPYPLFFPKEIQQLIIGANNNYLDKRVWFPCEDRYLPSRFFSYLEIGQTQVSNAPAGDKFTIQLDPATNIITISNKAGAGNINKLKNFIQKGMMVELETDRTQLGIANDAHLYLDGYYSVCDTRGWTNAVPDFIKLYPQDQDYGAIHQAYNISTINTSTISSGTSIITFRPNEMFNGMITIGLWVSTGVGNTIFADGTKVLSLANGNIINQNETTINGYNTAGQKAIRVNDITLVEYYETISAPANTYIPNTSHIATIIGDSSPDRLAIANVSSLSGSNIINVITNDGSNTPSLEPTLFYNISDDNDFIYNITTFNQTDQFSTLFRIDDYKRQQFDFFKCLKAPVNVLRVDHIDDLDIVNNILMFGYAGHYIDYTGITFTKVPDTFTSGNQDYNQTAGSLYTIGYQGKISLLNDMSYSLFTYDPLYMTATIGLVGVNQHTLQISEFGNDMFGNPQITLSEPLPIPIGSVDDAGFCVIQDTWVIDGTTYYGQISTTEFNIFVTDLLNMDGLCEGAFFATDPSEYLQFPRNTRIVSIHHPATYPDALFRIVLDTPTHRGVEQYGIYDCETYFVSRISISNPDGATAGTLTYTGTDLSLIQPYIGENKIISQAPLTFTELATSNTNFLSDHLYVGAVCKNIVAGMPIDNRITVIQDYQIYVDGVPAQYNTGIQQLTFQNPTTAIINARTILQIAQECIIDGTWITAIQNNGYITMTLSNALTGDFKTGLNKVKITKPSPNSGTIFMEDNLTANIPTGTTLTFTTTHTEITLDTPLAQDLPPNTSVYFSAIAVDEPRDLPFNLSVKPKGYSYELSNSGDLMDGRDYGIRWEDGALVGDVMYQYQLTTRANSGQVPNSDDNVSLINDVKALRIDGLKNRLPINNYNNNSSIEGNLVDAIDDTTDIIKISFPNISAIDFGLLFTDTSIIFNTRRVLTFYINNDFDSFTNEYCRVANGANDPHITPYVTVVKNIPSQTLTITGVKRGVLNSPKLNWGSGSKIYMYDENLFNEDFTCTINSESHELSDSGSGGMFNYDKSEGSTFFYTRQEPADVILKCEGHYEPGFTGKTTLFKLDKDYIFSCQSYSTKNEWVKHYEYQDIDLGGNIHLSPSDVGSIVTQQFHKPRNAKASMDSFGNLDISISTGTNRIGGLDIPESKGYIPHNRLYIPIWSTPVEEVTNHKSGVNYYSWFTGAASSVLRTEPYEYSFKFSCRFTNYPLKTATHGTYMDENGVNVPAQPAGTLIEGDWDVWTRGSKLTVPNALAPLNSTTYPIDLYGGGAVVYNKTDNPDSLIRVLFSQMCGTNNLTMNYNGDKNRTELMFCHNAYTTPVSMANNVVEGGDISTFIPLPAVLGHNKLRPFHSPYLSRTGGINIENYSGEVCEFGQYTPLTAFNNYNGSQTSKEYDMLNPFYNSSLKDNTNMENIGVRFWTKLGWTVDQLIKERGSDYNTTTGILEMFGSTEGAVDSADNQFFKEVPATDQGDPIGQQSLTINGQNVFAYGSVGGYALGKAGTAPVPPNPSASPPTSKGTKGSEYLKALNNSRTGYNLPSTSGTPLLPYNPVTFFDPDGVEITNPDYWLYTGYSVLSDGSSTLQATFLPEKTDIPYFLMFCPELSSNNNFYTTKNKGSIDPEAISIVSKLNVSQDYYFAYQSPITFYAKSDFILSTITTRVLTPQKTIPKNLGDASSVIYSITRYNPEPLTIKPTITQIQDKYFNNMIQMEKMKDQMTNQTEHQSELQKVNSLIESISESVLTPDENQASIITGVLQQAQNIGLFNMNTGQMRDFVVNHPMAVGMMNALTHIQNMGFNPRQPIADPEIQNVGRNVDQIITGVPVPNAVVQPMGQVLDMPFEPNISQPNTPIVRGGLPNPMEIADAINKSVYEESLLRGDAIPLKQQGARGAPKEVGYTTNNSINELTPTATLGNIIRSGQQILQPENPRTTHLLTQSGLGRQKFNQDRLALANKIAQKHSQLTENIAQVQYLPTERREPTLAPRNIEEQEARDGGFTRPQNN